ncbi:MAG TPA: PQQ-binding-like beta-propeller repeat protein [Bryobacteraceae bacterium]|jgi:PQQ-dependent dehydrogenase (methanol/ethanol family)|nr:PQQ-binding-like beta-propeller repeat protein [Bryobacteraceae bacterium]
MMTRRIFLALAVLLPAAAQHQQFERLCASCHGPGGSGTDRGPALSGKQSLATRPEKEIEAVIRNGTARGMPPFRLPEAELQSLTRYVRSLNTVDEPAAAGDAAAGERFFFGKGNCSSCHMVRGRGAANGPDLSGIARQLKPADLALSLDKPGASIAPGWGMVAVQLPGGGALRGFARSQGPHDLQLQTPDGRLLTFLDTEYKAVSAEKESAMPKLDATAAERRDLLAYLRKLDGAPPGPGPAGLPPITAEAIRQVIHPAPGQWPTYYGSMSANRHSPLNQIHTRNVGRLRLQWNFALPYFLLQTTPLVIDGVLYATGPNQVIALDARTGRQIWSYSRPRTPAGTIAGDAARGANRGVAALGDRIFFVTDDARLISLHRLTGALLWEVIMPHEPQHYGGTVAPLVVEDLVIAGVAGADNGIRGFVAAYKAATGEQAWRFWTIPRAGDPGFDTWKGSAVEFGGGSTWLTGSYDPDTKVLYWPTGNPWPDTDGDDRLGDNLYTNCILALDVATGKLRWYFQFTPHDVHDWDATEPPVLVDARFRGRQRKLLLHADRNGFYYVLDRITGEFLHASPFVKRITWASGIGPDGRPQLLPGNDPTPEGTRTCPDVRGATNWYSPAYNPLTRLFYVMTVENCSIYRQARNGGFVRFTDPLDQGQKHLRALDIETGKIVWEIPQIGPTEANYSGVLSTAGGLVFYGETGGGFAAVDAATGRTLWHFESNATWKASPMTYTVKGKQYVAVAAGSNLLSFALEQ